MSFLFKKRDPGVLKKTVTENHVVQGRVCARFSNTPRLKFSIIAASENRYRGTVNFTVPGVRNGFLECQVSTWRLGKGIQKENDLR